ncbi:hypothetical protein RQM65_11335 [Pricia sp. S334]|uniref:Uncharacterized protein n=1 Tax=Pricia mediterranea TaxID=3076079 RepID=A0ABU3L6H7_9FLAO|nr:hypothetical protein [Pricia sp. S334]MDT7829260.1 hypothetical protein [Pricia sp. S334]
MEKRFALEDRPVKVAADAALFSQKIPKNSYLPLNMLFYVNLNLT